MEVLATGFGDPSVLKIVPTDEVAPTAGEVVIDVRAAGVNHVDYTRYADPAGANKHGEGDNPFPMKLGVEVSGVVTAVGEDARGPAGPIVVGDEVIGYRVSRGLHRPTRRAQLGGGSETGRVVVDAGGSHDARRHDRRSRVGRRDRPSRPDRPRAWSLGRRRLIPGSARPLRRHQNHRNHQRKSHRQRVSVRRDTGQVRTGTA